MTDAMFHTPGSKRKKLSISLKYAKGKLEGINLQKLKVA